MWGSPRVRSPPLDRARPQHHHPRLSPDPQCDRRPVPLRRPATTLAAHRQAAEGRREGASRRGRGQGARQSHTSIRSAVLDKADIVFVELDGYRDASGYSGTRLVPVFHSRIADSVAPVRSIRPVDIPLLSPIHALIGNTGAARWVINYVEHYRAHLEGLLSYMNTLRTGSYGIDRSRVYTLNGDYYYDNAVVCHPAMLARQTKRFRSGPPQPYFPFASTREEVSAMQGKRGRSIRIPYKGDSYFMGYDYDKKKKRYLRSMPWGPHVLANGNRVSTDNVLVIKAKQRYGKIFRGGGHDEPLHDIINAEGKFQLPTRRAPGVRCGKARRAAEWWWRPAAPCRHANGR